MAKPKKRLNKKGQADLLNIIFGIIVISGGVFIAIGNVNLGSLIASLGLVFELIKVVVQQGA